MDCCNCNVKKTVRNEEQKKKLINRLSRIEGQIRGLKSMIENDCYCNDILNQSSAVSQAVNAFSKEVLSAHMHTCVTRDIKEGHDEVIDELMQTMLKMMR
ncbi:MAG: metal-sensing transcriptional repressor [Sphaerochaetaceae bacterium]|nr:metal-sensing transcriptional repressor [Sphaerochaetaceae bacterium]